MANSKLAERIEELRKHHNLKTVELLNEKEQLTILDVLSSYIRNFKARETY